MLNEDDDGEFDADKVETVADTAGVVLMVMNEVDDGFVNALVDVASALIKVEDNDDKVDLLELVISDDIVVVLLTDIDNFFSESTTSSNCVDWELTFVCFECFPNSFSL